ncbi:MAG: zinc ribbon domain-containing protein [Anaerolineales bacterium]
MTTQRRWFKVLLGGGIGLMALALVFGLLTPFVFSIAGPGGFGPTGTPGGVMGPGMMGGMMGPGMMGGGGFNGSFNAPFGFGPFGWLMALPGLLFPLGLLMMVGAGGVWLVQALRPGPVAQGNASQAPSKQCPNCGQPVQSNWRNCPHCGTALS